MNKLTIEHLAAYLPYGLDLKVTCSFYGYNTMKLCDKSGLSNIGISDVIDEPQDFKPILRPLSDLTTEIEHNGEKFVPTKEYHYLRFDEISTFKGGANDLIFMQVREYQILLELHFDVFGLIDKGLAIDIKEATNG
jgi:hypothetical protein